MATRNTGTGTTRKTSELLIVTRNEMGALARITQPLAKSNINILCFTGYEWNNEAAFRLVTDNNRKATEILRTAGYNIQENPVALWETTNRPGRLSAATTALAEANVNMFCGYQTSDGETATTTVVFNTSNVDRTIDVLKRLR